MRLEMTLLTVIAIAVPVCQAGVITHVSTDGSAAGSQRGWWEVVNQGTFSVGDSNQFPASANVPLPDLASLPIGQMVSHMENFKFPFEAESGQKQGSEFPWASSFGNVGAEGPSYVEAKGTRRRITRLLSPFAALHIDATADIIVQKTNSSESVTIEADDAFLPYITTNVEGENLFISVKPEYSLVCRRNCKGMRFSVKAKAIGEYFLMGNGDMLADADFGTETFQVHLIGSGNAKVTTTSKLAVVDIGGSGNVEIDGATDDAILTISGTGDIRSGNLRQKTTKATVDGAGNIQTWTERKLTATISGVGDISYRGSPVVVRDVTGVGRVMPLA